MNIAVLIPARDEAASIAATVAAALAIPGVTRVIVIDDGSEDDTDQLAEKAGAKVVRLFGSHGKGAALEVGAKRVEDADIVLLLDGDLGASAAQGALLTAPLLAGAADMAIATFPQPAGKAGFGLVKRLARFGIERLGGDFDAPGAALRTARAHAIVPRDRPALLGGVRRRGGAHHPGAARRLPPGRGPDDDVALSDGARPQGVRPPRPSVRARWPRTPGPLAREATRSPSRARRRR